MSKQDKILAKRMQTELNPRLDDVLNRKVLDQHLNRGTVKVATHPTLPLYLYDYSSLCERRSAWDNVTIQTRGLLRDNKGVLIARPMRKFFSYGGKSTSALRAPRWTDFFYATEKIDGTMLVASNFDGQLVLTTRASFDAWQIAEALKIWPEGVVPPIGETWVLEFVSPENRIVIEYDKPELFLLTVIDNWTGEEDGGNFNRVSTNFSVPQMYNGEYADEILKKGRNDGSMEGFVVTWPAVGKPPLRLKLKYDAYNLRHAEVFGRMNP